MSTDFLNTLLDNAASGNPRKYAAIIRAIESDDVKNLRADLPAFREKMELYTRNNDSFNAIKNAVSGNGYARQRKSAKCDLFGSVSSATSISNTSIFDVVTYQSGFLSEVSRLIFEGSELICNANIITFDDKADEIKRSLDEDKKVIGSSRADAIMERLLEAKKDDLQSLALEQQINSGSTTAFLTGIRRLAIAIKLGEEYCVNMLILFESYYNRLRHRHTEEGIAVQSYDGIPCPVMTDVVINIWENLDRSGDIEVSNNDYEFNIYTVNRAKAMIESIGSFESIFGRFNDLLILDIESVNATITSLRNIVIRIETILGNQTWAYNDYRFKSLKEQLLNAYRDLNVLDIPTEGRTKEALDKSEKFSLDHKNKSIKEIADLLSDSYESIEIAEIVNIVLKKKADEKKFLLEENSFFVCKIGTGNQFLGEPPGQIEIYPGDKPYANLDKIWGSGFDDMKNYIKGLTLTKKWAPLFLATSPSFSTDKSNVLLIGPQGCGKTELLRAVGADNNSISIFATGSDFLTCWSGEAQKNPKRLFQEAKKMQKISGRDVNILIDEIDQVLKKEEQGSSNINLSLEFQNIMDGVVAYPGIRVWGATNFPEKIPAPMLRRFARVEIVGQMDRDDRINTLRHYIGNFLPVNASCEDMYEDWADMLDGATGDIIRKVADDVWRTTIGSMIERDEKLAEDIVLYIKDTYGSKFEPRNLTDEDRELLKTMMSSHEVGDFVVTSAIKKLLSNESIKTQIAEACNTYAIAKQMKNKYT